MKNSKSDAFNTDEIKDTYFINKISSKYLPKAQDLNAKVEEIFKDVNKVAEENIRYIFGIISSPEFGKLVDELEPIILYGGELHPLETHNKQEEFKTQLKEFMKLPSARYYWGCLSLYYKGLLEVKVGYGYIEIGDEQFCSLAQIYQSKYRLFFVEFGQPQFREAIKRYLRGVGVLND